MRRKKAIDFILRPIYQTKDIQGYNCELIKTEKGFVQLLWKKENGKLILRYSPTTCLTQKVALEALCEWIENGEVNNYEEAIKKLKSIKGYIVTEDVKELTKEIFYLLKHL
ncbi:hypothetical protein SJAV_08350 [Sulfurisphaera javensis]|uniref:PqqD family protein n=1 Tax=Sulfurisphaera javensis TaxID=2049879 RepID=A0AAT9GQH9_9CREN